MRKQLCMWSAGSAMVVMAGWVYLAGSSHAADEADPKAGVLKIAAAIQKGDLAGADAQAKALAKKVEELGDVMDVFKKRDKGGVGVGLKKGVAIPDGIELMIAKMGRDAPSPSEAKKGAEAFEHMGTVIAAVAKITKSKPPAKVKGNDWNNRCDQLFASGLKLSAAAKDHAAADLKTIAHKIKDTCDACHSKYKN